MASVEEIIARTVAAERTMRGWTQQELAARSGLSESSIARLEKGKRRVNGNDLAPLCDALGISLTTLLARVDPEDRRRLRL